MALRNVRAMAVMTKAVAKAGCPKNKTSKLVEHANIMRQVTLHVKPVKIFPASYMRLAIGKPVRNHAKA